MSLLTILAEYWRFIKANLFRLLIGMILGGLVLVSARYVLSQVWMNNRDEAYQYLNKVYQQEPAEFQAIITIEDGQLFAASNIYDEYFSSPEMIKEVEAKTKINFSKWSQSEQELELLKSNGFRGGISVIRDSTSGLMTFRFLVGQTAEENLEIAKVYQDILTTKDFIFKDKHMVKITRPAEIIELLDLDMVESVPTSQTLGMFAGMTSRKLIIFSVLGMILGLLMTFLILWLIRLRRPEIAYAFEYAWDMDDQHLLIKDSQLQAKEDLAKLIKLPYLESRFVISQSAVDDIDLATLEKTDKNYYLNDLIQASQLTDLPQEIVLLIYGNLTDKQWYKRNYQLAKLYRLPIKIIHFIKE